MRLLPFFFWRYLLRFYGRNRRRYERRHLLLRQRPALRRQHLKQQRQKRKLLAMRHTRKMLSQQFGRSQLFRRILIFFQPWPIGRINP